MFNVLNKSYEFEHLGFLLFPFLEVIVSFGPVESEAFSLD